MSFSWCVLWTFLACPDTLITRDGSAGMSALRTVSCLLREAELPQLEAALADFSLAELEAKLDEGRPALLAALKEGGVGTLGQRQKLTNTL
jgi:hypothetical protein